MSIDRRTFLQLGGMSLALGMADRASADRRFDPTRLRRTEPGLPPRTRGQRETPTVLLVFLRGGADGLNETIPLESGEYTTYRDYRRTIGVDVASIDSAGTRLRDAGGADLQWGLNPRMIDFMPLWEAGYLAVMPAVHYPRGSRSHFDGQQIYENGTPTEMFTQDGWMNRHLATSPGDPQLRAISFASLTPFTMRGNYPTLTFTGIADLSVTGNEVRNDAYLDFQESAFIERMTGTQTWDFNVGSAGEALIDAIRAINAVKEDPGLPPTDPTAAAIYPQLLTTGATQYAYFANRLRDLAQLIKSDAFNIELAQVDLGGFDTHRDQVGEYFNHPDLCEVVCRGVRAFVEDLGDDFMQNVVIVVMTEFGRTSRENGSAGTDHGSAMATYVIAHPSRIQGRRVIHGPDGWHGLEDLRDNRDLKHDLDYRDVLAEIVRGHLGNDSADVFPGFTPTPVGFLT